MVKEYYQLIQKPFMEIGWYASENIIKFEVLSSYSLTDGKDITFEIAGFLAAKRSDKLLIKMDVPVTFSKETTDYILNETFHFLHEVGLRSVAYVHYLGPAYSPYANLVKEKFNFKVSVFSTEAEAIKWLE